MEAKNAVARKNKSARWQQEVTAMVQTMTNLAPVNINLGKPNDDMMNRPDSKWHQIAGPKLS